MPWSLTTNQAFYIQPLDNFCPYCAVVLLLPKLFWGFVKLSESSSLGIIPMYKSLNSSLACPLLYELSVICLISIFQKCGEYFVCSSA